MEGCLRAQTAWNRPNPGQSQRGNPRKAQGVVGRVEIAAWSLAQQVFSAVLQQVILSYYG